jgi:gliding motility-associated protein GldM
MAGGKETPRQKMIGMMYLVLTALLALNVSKQIVMAFVVVDTGLMKSNRNAVDENTSTYQHFDKALQNDQAKTKPYYDAAQTIKRQAEDMVTYIQNVKVKLVKEVDEKNIDKNDTMLQYVDAKDNFTDPTRIMVGESEDGSGGEGKKLQDKITEFRKQLITVFKSGLKNCSAKDSVETNVGLLTPSTYVADEGKKENWVVFNFSETPLVADIVTLTKLQNDVRSAESAMVNYLYSKIDANSFKVTDFIAKVIPSSSYVIAGDSFKADIFPSAYIATQDPTILIGDVDTVKKAIIGNGEKVTKIVNGIGKYGFRTDKEGPAVLQGVIQMRDPTGVMKSYPFKSSYIVAKAAVVISPTQMNTFYAGVDNPVDISVPGVGDNAIHPSMSYGSIGSGQHGHYIVRCTADQIGKDAVITVQATMPDGSKKNLPGQHFKVKRIPDPACATGGRTGDINISKLQLLAIPKVQAKMPDDFAFSGVSFTVVSFVMAVGSGGQFVEKTGNGGDFSGEMKTLLNQVPKGSYIIIKSVQVRGPDGKQRPIAGQSIKIN